MEEKKVENLVACLLLGRVILAILAGVLFGLNITVGAAFFAAALFLKAADTPLMVHLGHPIPADDEDYRWAAILTNAVPIACLAFALGIKNGWLQPALLVGITAGIMVLTRPFVKPHSLFAKARSGLVSFVLVSFLAVNGAPLWFALISLGFIWAGERYKLLHYENAATTNQEGETP